MSKGDDSADALVILRDVLLPTLRSIDESVSGVVAIARAQGKSWEEIGAVFGVSKQRAFQRFGPKKTEQ